MAYSSRSYGSLSVPAPAGDSYTANSSQEAESEREIGLGYETSRPICFDPLPLGNPLPKDSTVFPNSTTTQPQSFQIPEPEPKGGILHSNVNVLVSLLSA